MTGKKWYKSKTIWINLAAILAALLVALQDPNFQDYVIALLGLFGVNIDPAAISAVVVVAIAAINIALRLITNKPIE